MCAGLGATLLTIPLTLALPHDVKNLLKVPVGVSRVFSGGDPQIRFEGNGT